MASICYAPGGCKTCPYFRFYPDKVDYACYLGFDNQSLIAAAKARIPSLWYGDLIEKTIAEIYTELDENKKEAKYIHFLAYGYYAGAYEDGKKDHRFLEYTFFIAPLQKVLDIGLNKFESEYSDGVKQYIEDCTEDVMVERYLHYNAGECPLPIPKEKLDINIPDGLYILL